MILFEPDDVTWNYYSGHFDHAVNSLEEYMQKVKAGKTSEVYELYSDKWCFTVQPKFLINLLDDYETVAVRTEVLI